MKPRLAITSFGLLLPVACGGGGGSQPTATVQPSVAITEANAVDVASSAYGMFDLVSIARMATRFVETPPPEPAGPPVAPGVVVQTLPGPQGGEGVFTWMDHDFDTRYSSADGFAISFAGYADGGLELTGSIVFDGVEVIGLPPEGFAWTFSARIGFVSLRVAGAAFVTTLNGSLLFERETRATARLLTLVADEDLAYAGRILQAGGMLARNEYSIDLSTALVADATIEDALLGGALSFFTMAPMTGVLSMPDPWAGALRVEGGNSSVMDVSAIDLMSAELKVDLQGDEVVDVVVPVQWTTL